MVRHLLNIASIVCLVLCVALMGLWVRSLYLSDRLFFTSTSADFVCLQSIPGRVDVTVNLPISPTATGGWHLSFDTVPAAGYWLLPAGVLGFGVWGFVGGNSFTAPCWFLVLATGLLAMAFQLRWPWRFGLRSLFVATTSLAVVPGMSVWLDRAWIGK